LEQLPLPEELTPYIPFILNILYAILIFIIGWIASKWVHRLSLRVLRNRSVDESLSRFLSSIAKYIVLAATVIVALGEVGIETTSLVALLASAGLAVGLALQGSLSNFSSGVMILFFRPFDLGDKVTAGGHTGKVEDIGLFATTILTPDNEKIIIPNSSITSNSITNHTTRGTLRGNIEVGLAYGIDINQAIEVMTQASSSVPSVLKDPEPSVAFVGFGASSLDFVVRPWSTTDDYLQMLHDVRIALYDSLNKANIEIPFNQIVVHSAPPE
jgi:small conductance mechanosensitive channel